MYFVDHSGKLFGTKRVVSFHSRQRNGISSWKWECEKCGNVGNAPISSIKIRKCIRCSQGSAADSPILLSYGEICQGYYLRLRRAAKYRNWEWVMSPEDLWNLFLKQNRKCALSGREIGFCPKWSTSDTKGTTASLDRIDSTLGYTPDNVWWIHKDFQAMKMDIPLDTFISMCREVIHTGQSTNTCQETEVLLPIGSKGSNMNSDTSGENP